MKFLARIFEQLAQRGDRPVIQEVREGKIHAASGTEFLKLIQ